MSVLKITIAVQVQYACQKKKKMNEWTGNNPINFWRRTRNRKPPQKQNKTKQKQKQKQNKNNKKQNKTKKKRNKTKQKTKQNKKHIAKQSKT